MDSSRCNVALVISKLVVHLLVAIFWLLVSIGAGPAVADTTTVRFRLVDTESGKNTPALVSITGSDGEVRLPPDGRVMTHASTVEDFKRGLRFSRDPDWIGPVRKLRGKYPGPARAGGIENPPAIPYWQAPVMFQVPGSFTIDLPKGRWRIAVEHGNEYVPVVEDFTLDGKATLKKTIKLKRWINLPSRGWWSGDVHVHHPSLKQGHRDFLLEYAKAADVHVVNLLEMGHHWLSENDFKQAGFGKKFRVKKGDYWLVSGQEEPRGLFGHIVGLNTRRMVRDLKVYDWYDVAFDKIHEQDNALVGFAHFAVHWELMRGFPLWVTTEGLDYVELLQFGRINSIDYYDFLNLGFKLTAAAGSDIPFGAAMGEVRTYVYTGPNLDIDAWFAGLGKGNTFVSNGPALEFTVDGRLPGSEISKAAGGTARIKARVLSHPALCVPKSLAIVGNDGILKGTRNPDRKSTLTLEKSFAIAQSQWFVARADCENGAVAHSSPIYVIVDHRPHWSPTRGPKVIEKLLQAVQTIRKKHEKIQDERSRGLVKRLDKARDYYTHLLEEMKR